MRILFSVFFSFFVILFSFGQENPYPCVQINNDGNYVITRTINNLKELDNICEECKDENESVSQNLILTGFKICESCRISKTIFPI